MNEWQRLLKTAIDRAEFALLGLRELANELDRAHIARSKNVSVDRRALLREAADALERLHHSSYDGPGCSDCDLIRRLREAAK